MKYRWQHNLTPIEGRLWRVLFLANGDVVLYDDIVRRVWGCEDRSLYSHTNLWVVVNSLKKLGHKIITHKNVGLSLKPEHKE